MENKIRIENVYYLLSYAWDCIELSKDQNLGVDTFDNTENLLAKLLTVTCNSLLKRGLCSEYIEESVEVYGIKGKIDMSSSLKSGKLLLGKTICNTDLFLQDTSLNQVIKASILTILKCNNLNKQNSNELQNLIKAFSGVTNKKLSADLILKVKLNSLNRSFSILVELAKLIQQNVIISSADSTIKLNNFLESNLDMAGLFEKFLRNFYNRELKNAKVSAERLKWQIDYTSDSLFKERIPELRTDISIITNDKVIVMDAKFYQEAMASNNGSRFKYRREHISQIMEYLRTSNQRYSLNSYGVLLYPAVNYDINDFGIVEGLPIRVATIDLSKSWVEIRNKLIDIYNTAFIYKENTDLNVA